MPKLATSIVISTAVTAGSLGLAAWIFDGFDITWGWFLAAVVLFTALSLALRGVVVATVKRFTRAYTLVGGFVLTALVLLLTDWVVPSSGFEIEGAGTWIGVTLIVWAAGVAYGEVDQQAPPEIPPVSRRP